MWWRVYLFFFFSNYKIWTSSAKLKTSKPLKKHRNKKTGPNESLFVTYDMPLLYLPLRTATVAALVLMLIGQTLKPGRNSLLCLDQEVQQVFGYVAVFVIKKWCGETCLRHRREVKHHWQNTILWNSGKPNVILMKMTLTSLIYKNSQILYISSSRG